MSDASSKQSKKAPSGEHRTASRVMSILEMAAASEPEGVRLGDLAAPLEAPKSSIHGLAKGLVTVGYLREQGGRYFTGPALYALLGAAKPTFPATFHHALEKLTEEAGETSFIASLVGDSMVYVDKVDSTRAIRSSPPVHQRLPLWPRSAGKCLLAYMEPRRQDAALRKLDLTDDARGRIETELLAIRERSASVNPGEIESDQFGVASPIMVGEAVPFAIAVAGPATRMGEELDDIVAMVRRAAEELSY